MLGDVAGAHVRQPLVIPWSANHTVAPAALRNTVAATIAPLQSESAKFQSLA